MPVLRIVLKIVFRSIDRGRLSQGSVNLDEAFRKDRKTRIADKPASRVNEG
jgi:hypothetical protein